MFFPTHKVWHSDCGQETAQNRKYRCPTFTYTYSQNLEIKLYRARF